MILGLVAAIKFATRYVVTGYGLVSARLSGLCEYSNLPWATFLFCLQDGEE